MKKISLPVALGLLLLAAVGLVFTVWHSSGSSDANGDNTLIPKPRPGGPTFAADPAMVEAAKGKSHKTPMQPTSTGTNPVDASATR